MIGPRSSAWERIEALAAAAHYPHPAAGSATMKRLDQAKVIAVLNRLLEAELAGVVYREL